eukprot:scaffold16627_cov70-Skeletonema_dohrnii-CCMP3373.AAC.2
MVGDGCDNAKRGRIALGANDARWANDALFTWPKDSQHCSSTVAVVNLSEDLIAEVDEIKLKKCDACDLVRYCSDNCQQDHSQQHEATCKERAAELRDEILFRQPESSHVGDCPICCLPLPIEIVCCKSKLQTCCSKVICKGCFYANDLRQIEQSMDRTCPFCRHPTVTATEEEEYKMILKRVEANDPVAIAEVGR